MVITKNQLTSGYCERHQSEIKLTYNNDNHTMYLGLFSRWLNGGLSLSVLAGVSVADWVSPSSSCITCPLQSNSLCTTSVVGLLNTPSNKSVCLSLLQHNSHKNYHNTKKLKILFKYESIRHRLDGPAQKHQYMYILYQIWVAQVWLK